MEISNLKYLTKLFPVANYGSFTTVVKFNHISDKPTKYWILLMIQSLTVC